MKVEVWSDVACPFCYVGKRRFAEALAAFPHRDEVEVVWKSFQLNPGLRTDTATSLLDYLVREKGIPRERAAMMNARVGEMGAEVGISFDFEHAVPANTFQAHRLLQFAARQGLGDAAMERVFRAYFTEGRNVDDRETLLELGTEVGLDRSALETALADDEIAYAVRSEMGEAAELGISGVPFFVLVRKFGVSGAQEPGVFLKALEQAFDERATA